MDARERSVLATLAYYGALRRPLTLVELCRRLIPPLRLGGRDVLVPDLGGLTLVADELSAGGAIRCDAGLYTLAGASADLEAHRDGRQKESAQKWTRMLGAAFWLQAVPYVRMLAASGSLALASSSEGSDWDIFAVVHAGRLYTARLGLLAVAQMLGRLRTKRMKRAPDRFCFNHIITTDGLATRHRSIFTAHALAWLMPFYDPSGTAARVREANRWVTDFVAVPMDTEFRRRSVAPSRPLAVVRRAMEAVLDTFIGGILESAVRKWMQRRIAREPATHGKGGRVVADDRELEFHPHSFEAVALSRYNASLTRLGMGQYAEHDSGLVN